MRSTRWILAVAAAALSLAALGSEPSLHREKSFPAKPGGTVRVEAAFQDVLVTIRPGATVDVTVDVKVTGWGGSDEAFLKACEPQYTESGNTLVIRSKPSFGVSFGWRTTLAKIDVRMPSGIGLDLSSGSGDCAVKGDVGAFPVRAETGSGDILFDGACASLETHSGSGDVKATFAKPAEKAEVHTGSGDIVLSGPLRDLDIETGSGDVLADVQGGQGRVSLRSGSGDLILKGGAADLTAKSGSGSVSAKGLTGSADLRSSSGDILAEWAGAPRGGKVSAESSSGDVRLSFPSGARLAGRLESASGDVRCEFPGEFKGGHKREFALSAREGASEVAVETSSGDVVILASR